MERGYILLWRCIRDNHFWHDKPFDRVRAWIDLIMMANHTDGFIRQRGISVTIKRGQVGTAENTLAAKWGWSRGKVRRLLKDLSTTGQIVQQNNNVSSLITIVNYELYQIHGTASSTANDTADGQQTDSKQYRKKEFKHLKNKTIKAYGSFENVKLTEDERQKLTATFGDNDSADKIENLSLYLKSKGDKYKSHYATILSWARKNKPSNEVPVLLPVISDAHLKTLARYADA